MLDYLHVADVGVTLPTLLFHIKPLFQREVELECAKLRSLNLTVLQLGDELAL